MKRAFPSKKLNDRLDLPAVKPRQPRQPWILQINMPMVVIVAKAGRITSRLHDPEKDGIPDQVGHEADGTLGCRRNNLPVYPH